MTLDFHNIALIVSVLSGIGIPYLSALATKAPSWLTGFITMTLSAASGLIAELVAAPDSYDWRKALGAALTAWVLAVLTHVSQIAGTPVQAKLHAHGVK